MNYYAVIDTNVVVSAFLKASSIPDTLLSLVFSGIIIPLVNEKIRHEYPSVLRRKKFPFNPDDINIFIQRLRTIALFIEGESISEPFIDVSDKVFYEVVLEKRKTDDAYLVTGNLKHFPNKSFVVSPREMLEIIIDKID